MKCPRSDDLLRLIVDQGVPSVRLETHLEVCPECQAVLDRIAAAQPSDLLGRLVAEVRPASAGSCPEPEELAAWCEGTSLPVDLVQRIGKHVLLCESCGAAASLLRLELLSKEGPAAASHFRYGPVRSWDSTLSSAPSRAIAIAKVAGGLVLLVMVGFIIVPGLIRLVRPGFSTLETVPPVSRAAASTVVSGLFEYGTGEHAGTSSQPFSNRSLVQLSPGYQYAIELTAARPGWLMLVSEGSGDQPSLLAPDNKLKPLVHVEAGQHVRYPSKDWETVSAAAGQRRFYALYFESDFRAQAFIADLARASKSAQDAAAFYATLSRLTGDEECSNPERGCGITFEYEVF